MNLSVKLIAGRYPRWNADMRCWEESGVWQVFLDRKRIVAIPAFAILNEVHAGDEDVVIELRQCAFTAELEQMLWREEMGITK